MMESEKEAAIGIVNTGLPAENEVCNQKWNAADIWIVLGIMLVTVAVRLPTLVEPWGGDQAVFGYIADGMLKGDVPYQSLYTSTGYGIVFAYALFFKIFGTHMAAIHLGDLAAWLMTVWLVYALTRRLYGRECAVIAATAAVLFGCGRAFSGMVDLRGGWGTYWQLAQRETFMTPLLTGSLLLGIWADSHKKLHPWFWSGALIGLAAAFKMTAVLMSGVLFLYIILGSRSQSRTRIKNILYPGILTVLGFIAANIPFLIYFWRHGALHDMYRAVVVHTSIYAKLTWGNIVADAFRGNAYILSENLFLWIMSAGALIYLLMCRRRKETYLVLGWIIVALWMVWGQGKFFGYHFFIMIAPLSVLTGLGMKQFMKTMPTWRESIMAARNEMTQAFLWMMLAWSAMMLVWNSYEYCRWHILYASGRISKEAYYEVFNEYPLHLYSFRANREVADYLKHNASPGATFRDINGGGESLVNFLAGMKSVTRFTSTWYLFNKQLYHNPLTAQLRQEFIDGVTAQKPDYIMLVYFTEAEFRKEYPESSYPDIWKLIDYLGRNYRLVESFRDGRVLYQRI
jgi:hypothetical protein